MGHESAGVVEAVGSGVSSLNVGDQVVTCLARCCNVCEFCTSGRTYLCVSHALRRGGDERPRLSEQGISVAQASQLGSFAEKMLVHEHSAVRVPELMPLDRAALLGCAALTGLGAVFRTAKVQPGAQVAVVGCGGIGLFMVQGARIAGADVVLAIDTNPHQLEIAELFGATDTFDATDCDTTALRTATGGGVDVLFEAVGNPATVSMAFDLLREGGTTVVAGLFGLSDRITVPAMQLLRDRRIQGCVMGSHDFRVDIPPMHSGT